jgi:hypothetical protein
VTPRIHSLVIYAPLKCAFNKAAKPKLHEVRKSILLISKGMARKSVCAY